MEFLCLKKGMNPLGFLSVSETQGGSPSAAPAFSFIPAACDVAPVRDQAELLFGLVVPTHA